MNANTLLSTIILVSFIVTVVLAVGSYMAYKVRESRRPKTSAAASGDEPVFFERFYVGPSGGATSAEGTRGPGA